MNPVFRKKLCVVLNSTSGTVNQLGVEQVEKGLREVWENLGCEIVWHKVEGETLTAALTSARDGDADIVVVGGGDGTVAAAASVFAGHPKVLGILPLGTFNLAARDVGMPMDYKDAAALLVSAPSGQIDLLEVGERLYLCMIVLGFYPSLMIGRPEYHGSWIVKAVRTLWDAVRSAATIPPLNLRITEGTTVHTHRTRVAIIANNDYENMFGVIPVRQSLDAGYFTVYISTHQTQWGLMKIMAAWLVGRWKHERQIVSIRATEVEMTIRHNRRISVMRDGELDRISLPLKVRLKPKSLWVVAPRLSGQE